MELATAFTRNAVAGILKKISKSEALLLDRIDTLSDLLLLWIFFGYIILGTDLYPPLLQAEPQSISYSTPLGNFISFNNQRGSNNSLG